MSCSGTSAGFGLRLRHVKGNFFPIIPARLRHADAVKAFILVLLLTSGAARAEETLAKTLAAPGQLIVTQFVSAPFPHASRAEGRTYRNSFFPADKHYADSTVAIFIPKDFRARAQNDFVIHFHGWRNTVSGTLTQYQLAEQLVASGRNAILIVPEGPRDAPDSGGGKLEDPDGFKRFMAEALALLQQRGVLETNAAVGNIILSGHSGGYQVMSSIVDRGGLISQVREVWLFDGLYAQSEKFLTWADQTQGRLLNIYTDGGGTKVRTEEMMATLKQQGKPLLATTDQTVTPAELKTNRLVFLHTDLSHNEVVEKRKTFQRFLETSCLPLRLEKPGETSKLLPYQAVPKQQP
ncbi:MAG: hypothetical protein AAB370_07360 [Verrucomicrobiota bacterium]